MITVYGIKNCDTCGKARKWFDAEGIAYRFHDIRRDGLEPALVATWATALGWETLINRRGATWRKLPDAKKSCLTNDTVDEAAAIALVLANPTLVKRPVFDLDGAYTIGFKEAEKAFIQTRLKARSS